MARMPCRIRTACRAVSAPRTDVGPGRLPGVRDGGHAAVAGQREHLGVGLGRELGLEPAQPEPDDAAVAVGDGVPGGQLGHVHGVAARDVGRQPDLHAVPLAGLLGAVAEAGEDLVPAAPAADGLGRGEDALQVDRAVAGRLGGVVHHDLAEVALGAQHAGGDRPGLEEMVEVAVLVQAGQPLGRVGGQRDVVAPGDVQQRASPGRCPPGAHAARSSGNVTAPIIAGRGNRPVGRARPSSMDTPIGRRADQPSGATRPGRASGSSRGRAMPPRITAVSWAVLLTGAGLLIAACGAASSSGSGSGASRRPTGRGGDRHGAGRRARRGAAAVPAPAGAPGLRAVPAARPRRRAPGCCPVSQSII